MTKKLKILQNQGIHLIFYVTKATIKDNWSRFQIKQKDEFAPVLTIGKYRYKDLLIVTRYRSRELLTTEVTSVWRQFIKTS